MSFETGTPDPTADAEATTETAPATSAPASTGMASVGTSERTYTQADMDRAAAWYRKSVREERERIEREYASQREPETDQADPAIRRQLEAMVGPMIAPLRQQQVEISLDRAVSTITKRYPDFEANQRDILEAVVEMGLDKATHIPLDQMLDMAYRYWKHDKTAATPPVDVESIKKQAKDEAIKDYLDKMKTKSSNTPRPEGPGGSTPASTDPQAARRTKKGALDAALQYVQKSKAAAE